MKLHSFVYDPDALARLARWARSLSWRLRFVGFSIGECGVFFVRRSRDSGGLHSPGEAAQIQANIEERLRIAKGRNGSDFERAERYRQQILAKEQVQRTNEDDFAEQITRADETILRLRSLASSLAGALRRYGRHSNGCPVSHPPPGLSPGPCTCGLGEALAEYEKAVKQ